MVPDSCAVHCGLDTVCGVVCDIASVADSALSNAGPPSEHAGAEEGGGVLAVGSTAAALHGEQLLC